MWQYATATSSVRYSTSNFFNALFVQWQYAIPLNKQGIKEIIDLKSKTTHFIGALQILHDTQEIHYYFEYSENIAYLQTEGNTYKGRKE